MKLVKCFHINSQSFVVLCLPPPTAEQSANRMELRPLVMCFALCVVYATSKPTKQERVHHDLPLSSREHDDGENFDYDHEAFLGQEEAKSFEQLTPEESKERLG